MNNNLELFPARIASRIVKASECKGDDSVAGGFIPATDTVVIPVADTAYARTVRLHESAHAIWSRDSKLRCDDYVGQALEDAKIHSLLATDGEPRRDELTAAIQDLRVIGARSTNKDERAIQGITLIRAASIMAKPNSSKLGLAKLAKVAATYHPQGNELVDSILAELAANNIKSARALTSKLMNNSIAESRDDKGESNSSESKPEGTPSKSESKPEGTPSKSESKPEGTPSKSESKPEGTPSKSESKPEGTPSKSESKPEGTPSKSESKPEGTPSKSESKPEGTPSKSESKPEGTPSKSESKPEGTPSKSESKPEGTPSKSESKPEGTPSKSESKPEGTPSKSESKPEGTPSKSESKPEGTPSKSESKPEGTPSKSESKPEGTPSKSESKPEGTPSKSESKPEGTPSKSESKPEGTPSKSESKPEGTPSKSESKPEGTPSKSESKPEGTPSKSESKPEGTPSKSESKPEGTPSKSESKPSEPSKSESKPSEPSKSESKPTLKADKEESIPDTMTHGDRSEYIPKLTRKAEHVHVMEENRRDSDDGTVSAITGDDGTALNAGTYTDEDGKKITIPYPIMYVHTLSPNATRKVRGRGANCLRSASQGMKIRTNRLALNAANPCGGAHLFETKHLGGTVLLDASGSMHIDDSMLYEIAEKFPAGKVAYYSGTNDGWHNPTYYLSGTCPIYTSMDEFLESHWSGHLVIYAQNGRIRRNNGSSLPKRDGSNLVDYQALLWLLQQPGPRYIMTDGSRGGYTGPLRDRAKTLLLDSVRSKKIKLFKNVESLMAEIAKIK